MRALIEQLLMKLLAALAERKPAQRAEQIQSPGGAETPIAIKPHEWKMPAAEDIDRARGECSAYGWPHVKICRGPGKGCNRSWREQGACPDCYMVRWYDTRPSAEIRAAMERGDA